MNNNNDNFWLNVAAIHYLMKEHREKHPESATPEAFLRRMVIFLILDVLFIIICSYLLKR